MTDKAGWAEGVILTDAGEVIAKPRMAPADFLATKVGRNATRPDSNKAWYRVEEVLIDGNSCVALALFGQSCLGMFFLELTPEESRRRFGSEEPTADNTRHRTFYEEWLTGHLGDAATRTYEASSARSLRAPMSWGEIMTVTDLTIPESFVKIVYSQPW